MMKKIRVTCPLPCALKYQTQRRARCAKRIHKIWGLYTSHHTLAIEEWGCACVVSLNGFNGPCCYDAKKWKWRRGWEGEGHALWMMMKASDWICHIYQSISPYVCVSHSVTCCHSPALQGKYFYKWIIREGHFRLWSWFSTALSLGKRGQINVHFSKGPLNCWCHFLMSP